MKQNLSKALTLLYLKSKLTQSKIEDLYVLSIFDWRQKKELIIDEIPFEIKIRD